MLQQVHFTSFFPSWGTFIRRRGRGKWTDGADDGKQENKKLCTEERDATCRQEKRREEKIENGPFLLLHARGNAEALKWSRPSHLIPQIVDWYCRHNRPPKEGTFLTVSAPHTVESLGQKKTPLLHKGFTLKSCPRAFKTALQY